MSVDVVSRRQWHLTRRSPPPRFPLCNHGRSTGLLSLKSPWEKLMELIRGTYSYMKGAAVLLLIIIATFVRRNDLNYKSRRLEVYGLRRAVASQSFM